MNPAARKPHTEPQAKPRSGAPDARDTGEDADWKQAAPDVDSDRVPATDAEPEGSLDRVKSGPLGIQQIENLEDDAKGG